MKIIGKNKTIDVPMWAVLLAIEVVDNLFVNVCKVVDNHNLRKVAKEVSKNEAH